MPSGCPVTPGFPIRRSPDQSSFDSSPRLIAACHVLHRLSTPRHPPCTLTSLTTLMIRSRSSILRRFDCIFSPGGCRATSATSWFRSPLHPITCAGKTHMQLSGVSLFACQRATRGSHRTETPVMNSRVPNSFRRRHRNTFYRVAMLKAIAVVYDSLPPCPPASSQRTSLHWSRPGSNRQPPGCKPGALPVELQPRCLPNTGQSLSSRPFNRPLMPPGKAGFSAWAREDSNFRPRPYQGRALAN